MSVVVLAISYMLGSVSVGYLFGKVKGIDVRSLGSGNIGTTNILRTMGVVPAILVLVLDAMKGLVAVLLANWLVGIPAVSMLCGIAAVVGHNWPLWFEFKGGRGIATSMGVILAFNPLLLLVLAIFATTIIFITRYVSLGSMTAATRFPPFLLILRNTATIETNSLVILLSFILTGLAFFRHRDNIKRLRQGTESKIGERIRQ